MGILTLANGVCRIYAPQPENPAEPRTQNEPEVLDCGKYDGMTTKEARKAILADLEAGGYIKEIEPLKHDVGTCYRCHSDEPFC